MYISKLFKIVTDKNPCVSGVKQICHRSAPQSCHLDRGVSCLLSVVAVSLDWFRMISSLILSFGFASVCGGLID